MEIGVGISSPPSLRSDATSAAHAETTPDSWRHSLAEAVRDPAELIELLQLPTSLIEPARRVAEHFPLIVPRSFLARMTPGDVSDPLLRQVLPLEAELSMEAGFASDPVGDGDARVAPGLLHKYEGRALLIAAGACAVHCRYCFRRHYAYNEEPRRLEDWEPALAALREDTSITEVILSGGDPLVLSDRRLSVLFERLAEIDHLRRIRIHSRLPIVLPNRVTRTLLELLQQAERQTLFVVHANHPHEIADDCREALRMLVAGGIPTLNQAVLLRGVNDSVEALAELSLRLVDIGIFPYYLHQLDRVQGAAHFEVSEAEGRALIDALRARLPGYAVPRFVREIPGAPSKTPLEMNP